MRKALLHWEEVINMDKKVKKIVFPTALILGVILVGLLSMSAVSAQNAGYYPSIVQKIADKFNLNEADVQEVFDDERDEHYADIEARWSERLDDLVTDGKITAEQKQAIVDKHSEMHDKMQAWKNLDPETRRENMGALRDELKTWAEENNIDMPLMGPMGHGMMQGFRGGFMMDSN